MKFKRKVASIVSPREQPGFLGAGHTMRPVVMGDFRHTDPFILLADDMIDKRDDVPVGGAHPHAGFETVSLLLDGELIEVLESMKAGDFQVMTAGSGIVHAEALQNPFKGRLLQMWLTLPQKDRWTTPRLQILPAEQVPAKAEDGVRVRVYSGSVAGLTSPVENYVPLIAAEFRIDAGRLTTQVLPADFNTFIYVIEGSLEIGGKRVGKDQVAWLDRYDEDASSELDVLAGSEGVRFVLYAAKPVHEEIVSHGPFIADTEDEIRQLYRDFRAGKFQHISSTPEEQRVLF